MPFGGNGSLFIGVVAHMKHVKKMGARPRSLSPYSAVAILVHVNDSTGFIVDVVGNFCGEKGDS